MNDETYSQRLAAANKCIRTRQIKGNEYAEVNQRILAFWELFPDGYIETTCTEDTGKRCDFTAAVYRNRSDREAGYPVSTGHAYEVREGMVNSTSYVENCETSAIGRALGVLGIGAVDSVASAEEVENAIARQERPKAKSSHDWDEIRELIEKAKQHGLTDEELAKWMDNTFEGRDKRTFGEDERKVITVWLKAYLRKVDG